MLQIMPLLAYGAAAVFILGVALARGGGRSAWLWPAGLAVLFLGFTGLTLLREGVMPFWANHSTTYAGNQVWFDLLLAVAIAFYLIAPRARAVGMRLWPWALAVVATASVALLPMLARLLWLERRATQV